MNKIVNKAKLFSNIYRKDQKKKKKKKKSLKKK